MADVVITVAETPAQLRVGTTATGPAGGDLSGSFPNPTVTKLAGVTPSAYHLTLLPAVDAASTRTLLGLGTGDSPTFAGLSITGTTTVGFLSSTQTGALTTFNSILTATWQSSATAVIVGSQALNFGVSALATGASLSNQIQRITYTKSAGAVAASTTAFTAGIDLGFSFNESESGGNVYGYNHTIIVATGKTVGTQIAFNANPLSGGGSVTNLYSFRAITGSGSSHFADGVYVGGTFSSPGAGNLMTEGSLLTKGATSGTGYGTGAGGTVTQATSRSTGVTINKVCGSITLVSAAGSTTPTAFVVTNSAVAATDVVVLNQKSGTDKYILLVTAVGAGSFTVTAYTTGGTTTEQPVINFAIIKAVTA